MSENEIGNGNGNGNGGKELFKRMVKGGRRTYFISVKESKNNKKYVMLTESKLIEKDKFERFSIFVFPEKMGELIGAMQEAAEVAV